MKLLLSEIKTIILVGFSNLRGDFLIELLILVANWLIWYSMDIVTEFNRKKNLMKIIWYNCYKQ